MSLPPLEGTHHVGRAVPAWFTAVPSCLPQTRSSANGDSTGEASPFLPMLILRDAHATPAASWPPVSAEPNTAPAPSRGRDRETQPPEIWGAPRPPKSDLRQAPCFNFPFLQ